MTHEHEYNEGATKCYRCGEPMALGSPERLAVEEANRERLRQAIPEFRELEDENKRLRAKLAALTPSSPGQVT